jgi:hypothetical protein
MSSKAFGVVHFFPGGTKEQYAASIAAVHPSADALPEGQIVHDSKESWESFRDGTLLPRMQAGIEGGFTGPPTETPVDLDTVIP